MFRVKVKLAVDAVTDVKKSISFFINMLVMYLVDQSDYS